MRQQTNCPRCRAPISVDLYQVVDARQDPELKQALLNGQLNAFSCPSCGLTGQMASPVLFHDPEHELLMVYVPMEMNLPHVEQERLIGRLVQQVIAARGGLAQSLRSRVAVDQESRNLRPQGRTQALDGLYSCLPIRQTVVGNDQVGLPLPLGQPCKRG